MDNSKSKTGGNTVPTISVKFHANAEQIEGVCGSDREMNATIEKAPSSVITIEAGDPETNSSKSAPKLGKRSSSIDVSQQPEFSSPSDPWRFFSDIRGKITKSVEERITEIKTRNQEEGSPHKSKLDTKVKSIQDSSSVSDSEDLSESSLSKTCGIISTTEGVEMSSDEDTPSLEKDRKDDEPVSPASVKSLNCKFRFLKNRIKHGEGTVNVKDLARLCNINSEANDQVFPEDSEVESAIDALEDVNMKNDVIDSRLDHTDVLQRLSQSYGNIDLEDENMISVNEVTGKDILDKFYNCKNHHSETVFAPMGFVDFRHITANNHRFSNYITYGLPVISILIYFIIHHYSSYMAGFAAGVILSLFLFQIYLKCQPAANIPSVPKALSVPATILEVQAVKEHQPLLKYEGWVNEYPDVYNADTYHISQTQSVFLRLQGNLLRLSHSRNKIPKRAMWNEPEIKCTFSHHRIYNLVGAKIDLLPEKLAKKRHWSKKYPICITLTKDQMIFDHNILPKLKSEIDKTKKNGGQVEEKYSNVVSDKVFLKKRRKRDFSTLAQRFSKLTEDEEFDLDSDSRASTPSGEMSDVADIPAPAEDEASEIFKSTEDIADLAENVSHGDTEIGPSGCKIYLFGRTDREKEDWFRRLTAATHDNSTKLNSNSNENCENDLAEHSDTETVKLNTDYIKYMSIFKAHEKAVEDTEDGKGISEERLNTEKVLWLNSLIGRVLFDCMRDPNFACRVKERIERKLSTIKLPYFIEELLIPELSLGKTCPLIERTSKPIIDERGLWVDLDITYEGAIVLTLQTKLNLMRLKNSQLQVKPELKVRSAIYDSDVDDSAESSSDEDGPQEIPNLLNDPSTPASTSSSSGKKFIKMVDRLAESKFFRAATENRYIKKAMEGVSNTDLRLTVEVKSIMGTLVLNIPSPPTDRVWLGFRPLPDVILSARPIVGERNINYIMVTSWIEKKLLQEFQKVLVIPNMEDFIIPVMNPKLPD